MSAPSHMPMNEDSRESVMQYVQNNIDSIVFKSLKCEEMDPPANEKLSHMNELLTSDPGLFLTRWGRYLPSDELNHFEPLRATHYEVDIQLQELLEDQADNLAPAKPVNPHLRKKIINRRFQYLKNVLKGSEYFTEEAMRLREPSLYEYYIGQHVPQHLRDRPYGNDVNLVQRIMYNLDRSLIDEKLRAQQIIEAEQEEEEEEEEENLVEERIDMDSDQPHLNSNEVEARIAPLSTSLRDQSAETRRKLEENNLEVPQDEPSTSLSPAAKEQIFRDAQKDEYVRVMEELFLEGRDPSFDYKDVDENAIYDDLDQVDMDLQDKYFDEEDEDMESNANETGVYDY